MNIYNMRTTDAGLPELVDKVHGKAGHMLTMIEIGSYAGQSMEIFANTKKVSKIICIDPWQKGYDSKDPASSTDMDEVEKLFDARASQAKSLSVDVIKHKGTIDTFIDSQQFEHVDSGVDFVYVDARHQYDSVKHDILLSLERIKPKIAICGHDFAQRWRDVIKAVEDTVGQPDAVFADSSWLKFV